MPAGYESITDHKQELDLQEHGKDNILLYGYKTQKFKYVLSRIVNVVLIGIPWLLSEWSYTFKAWFWYSKCSLEEATVVLVIENVINTTFVPVITNDVHIASLNINRLRFFIYQHLKYVWFEEKSEFRFILEMFPKKSLKNCLESKPLTLQESHDLLEVYGENDIKVEVKSYWRLFIEEIITPFYIFQIFSIMLWTYDDYAIYAGCVLFLLLLSAFTSLYQTRKQSVALHDMIQVKTEPVQVLQSAENQTEGNFMRIKDSKDLIPGDIMIIPRYKSVLTCDCMVLTGKILVNEATLTGESTPETKTPPASDNSTLYIEKNHKRHTIYAGTEIIQARFYNEEHVLALVTNTGFNTVKGNLVNSILNPVPIGLKFYNDSILLVKSLFVLATFGVAYSIYLYVSRKADASDVIVRALDIFTILVPPALPAAMTVGMSYSQNRLRKIGIYCISPQRINICGKVKLACFDKTGTLTDEGLVLSSVVSYEEVPHGTLHDTVRSISEKSLVMRALATCHSLILNNDEIIGDPVDLAMFEATDWVLEESGGAESSRYDVLGPTIVRPKYTVPIYDSEFPYEIAILKEFVFTSNDQCMSVITRDLNIQHMQVFTKGAPEKIASICTPDSVPEDFNQSLRLYAAQGYRVLAIAYKNLPASFKLKNAHKCKRNAIECDLRFLGFIIMKNNLKPETTPVISELRAANIRTVMITGDNIMTAISVARNCDMVNRDDAVIILKYKTENENVHPILCLEGIGEDINLNSLILNQQKYHYALDGKTWDILQEHYLDILPSFLMHTIVFARFQPDQKTQLVNAFQKLDYIVSMVGDGANDCGALKAAHVGISLSQAEASVAAPFTSSKSNISCVSDLIKEGRCALVTSFATFKYMMLYSLIQFFSIMILYTYYTTLGDWQFLFIDLIITTVLAVTIGYQGPSKKLVPKRPMGSLIAPKNIIPILLQISICGILQYGAILFLKHQKWYEPLEEDDEETILCWENTVIFLLSCFQYITMAILFSKGPPYRQSIWKNTCLLLCSTVLIAFVLYISIHPCDKLAEILEIEPFDKDKKYIQFRAMLMIFPLVHLYIAAVAEVAFHEKEWFSIALHVLFRKTQPKNRFKRISANSSINFLQQHSSGANRSRQYQQIALQT